MNKFDGLDEATADLDKTIASIEENLKPQKKCNCCGREFKTHEIAEMIKEKPLYWTDSNDNIICWQFDCSCGSTLTVKVAVLGIDPSDIIKR